MAFLFRNKQKSNLELTRSIKELTQRLAQEDKANPKVRLCPTAAGPVTKELTGNSWKRDSLWTFNR